MICLDVIINLQFYKYLKSLVDFKNKFNQMNIDLGLDLQECEMDTYKNYRGRWSKNA